MYWLCLEVRNILTVFTPLSSVGYKVSITLAAGLWRQNEREGWAHCHPSGKLADVSEEARFIQNKTISNFEETFWSR